MTLVETTRAEVRSRRRDILLVAGLAKEAACAPGEGVRHLLSGAETARLHAPLARMRPDSIGCVVSFGLAGGLCKSLAPGDLVVAREVAGCGARRHTDARLARVLLEGLAGAREGVVAGVDAAVMDPPAKWGLRDATGATIVDMESHVAADFAHRHDIPFAVVRVVTDPAHRALPRLAATAVKPDGGVDILLILRELSRDPLQIQDLIRAGLDARAAFATLARCGPLLAPLTRLALAEA